MDTVDATIAFVTDWLTRRNPVEFTGIMANAHYMAHPHTLFQQIVTECPGYWRDEHRYVPEAGKKAGVRARPFPMFRDQVLLPALRLYRARLEGVPVNTIPEVEYAYKRQRDNAGNLAIRSIWGFAMRTKPMPTATLPIDTETCAPQDNEDDALETAYKDTLGHGLAPAEKRAPPVARRTLNKSRIPGTQPPPC